MSKQKIKNKGQQNYIKTISSVVIFIILCSFCCLYLNTGPLDLCNNAFTNTVDYTAQYALGLLID